MYPTKILLATDGSKESTPAVRTAVELTNATGSELHVAHAISTAPQRPYPRHFGRAKYEDTLQRKKVAALVLLDEKVRQAETMGGIVTGSYFREGDPVKEVLRLAEDLAEAENLSESETQPLWWALALGADFGGNLTLIGASANVVVAGMSERAGQRISFVKFMIYGIPVTLVSLAIATAYVVVRYYYL